MNSKKGIYCQLLHLISHDRANPSTKQQLSIALGANEREIRRQIALARRDGVWIVSLLSGGYYITDSAEEWNEFCKQERRRAIATFKRAAEISSTDGSTIQLGMLDICAASNTESKAKTPRRDWRGYEREKAVLQEKQHCGETYECEIREIADRLEV